LRDETVFLALTKSEGDRPPSPKSILTQYLIVFDGFDEIKVIRLRVFLCPVVLP
jgi:hypothetical protein